MVANFTSVEAGSVALHAQVSGREGAPTVLLLHGLFGMGSNLGSLARALGERFSVHQLDLPNHGRSPWQADVSLPSLAAAVADYASAVAESPAAVVGHSLGGKVAMQLALSFPDRFAAVVIADIAPLAYPATHGPVFAALHAVTAAAPASRSAARQIMEQHAVEPEVVQFLLLSLARDDAGNYRWRFNVEALEHGYDAIREPPRGALPCPVPALFIYGTASAYVQEAGLAAARETFSAAEFAPLERAGHWLHAEQPEAFNTAVCDFLDRTVAASS